MASTNQTPNLGLCQWVLDDPFLMEDMNADNAKIDAAVAANPYVKLMDVTTTADAQQVNLDLSSIDINKFVKLELYIAASCYTYESGTGTMDLQVLVPEAYSRWWRPASSSQFSRNYVSLYYLPRGNSGIMRLDITPLPENGGDQLILFNGTGFCMAWSDYLSMDCGGAGFYRSSGFKTLGFLSGMPGAKLKAGSSFKLYGVTR